MKESYNKILEVLEKDLTHIESETEDILQKAELCIKLIKSNLKIIKGIVITSNFETVEAEIDFFKNTKPKIYSKLIYYVKLFNIESKRPKGSAKFQKKYLDAEIKKLQDYFNDNLEFYQYFRSGTTLLDNQYFLRGKEDIRLYPDHFHFFTDDKFSTSHDSTVATIMAYDMLIVYLQTQIRTVDYTNSLDPFITAPSKNNKLAWTAPKVDLVELIYALYASGAINGGIADIKELALLFEHAFTIELGDYYRVFLAMRTRKINRTKFMDHLKDSLLLRMDEIDQ